MSHASRNAIPAGFNPDLYASGEAAVTAQEIDPDQRIALAGLAAQAAAQRQARIAETFGNIGNTPEGQSLLSKYEAVHNNTRRMFSVAGSGEHPPSLDSSLLVEQVTKLVPVYQRFESLGLAPELVLTPSNRPLEWWESFAAKLTVSGLNPDDPTDPTRSLLRDGGLWMSDEVQSDWDTITNPRKEAPSWSLSIVSSLDAPVIKSITSYGYTDAENQTPSPELNKLLKSLGEPEVKERGGRKGKNLPLTQPSIHPTADAYLALQFNRITQNQGPVDANNYSWLAGELQSGRVPGGDWDSGDGRVNLGWGVAAGRRDHTGVRPSGRG